MTTDQLSALLAQDPAAVLEHDRRLYEQQIIRAADLIAAHAQERPAVLLAGPSGSGKTTTALLIERELDRRGMETHTLSMDDYFCPLTERELELFSRNELDLERPSRVDVPFFQEQLGKLLAGEEVELPRYDFKNSVRVFDGRTLRRRPGELVILEGIHALNPEVTGYDGRTTRIYVSVRTRITPRSGHPLHPSKIRLVRRMLRDGTGRGRALSETIAMRERVDRGEQRYIMPFKPRAHGSIDSFYSAELGVYRPLLRDELERLSAPGLGQEVGANLGLLPSLYQGFFLAPTVVASALKGAIFAANLYERLGFRVVPNGSESRHDIIQAVELGSREGMIAFCKGIQSAAPVDSYADPIPSDMPGYEDEVIMAAGAFVQGSSIELSADGPIRPPYAVYFQGGLTWYHAKLGILLSLQNMADAGLATLPEVQ